MAQTDLHLLVIYLYLWLNQKSRNESEYRPHCKIRWIIWHNFVFFTVDLVKRPSRWVAARRMIRKHFTFANLCTVGLLITLSKQATDLTNTLMLPTHLTHDFSLRMISYEREYDKALFILSGDWAVICAFKGWNNYWPIRPSWWDKVISLLFP